MNVMHIHQRVNKKSIAFNGTCRVDMQLNAKKLIPILRRLIRVSYASLLDKSLRIRLF